jgi:hypothetical protein
MINTAIAVTSWASNHLDIVGVGVDHQMYHKVWDGSSWRPSPTSWESLGGALASAPAVASWGSDRLDIFSIGADRQMYHKAWDRSAWSPSPTDWESLGGAFTSPPAVASWGINRLDVFGVGSDKQMYHKAWDGSAWRPSPTGWEALGGTFASAPAVASWAANRLDIFAIGPGNRMYHKAWDGTAWLPSPSTWESLGGVFTSPPAVASWGTNRLDVFAVGPGNRMFHKAWDGTAWRPSTIGWDALGAAFTSPPAVVSWASNRLDVFAVGLDNQMYHKAWDGHAWRPTPTGWEPLHGAFASAPAAASWASNHLDVLGTGPDGQIYHKALNGSAWTPSPVDWEALGWFIYCSCDQCQQDLTVTCSYTGTEVAVDSVYLANAYRGHLILSPGDAGGFIGGLLHQLDPPQHYSHMGIMVADFSLVRHATASLDRLMADEYFTGSVFSIPAPSDGFNHEHVRYEWPGTVTQSIEQAFIAARYGAHPPGSTSDYTGADLPDLESAKTPPTTFPIKELSFDTVWDTSDGFTFTPFPALVVKPCPALETADVRRSLDLVADKVMDIYGHYRFYVYTHASVASDPEYQSLPTQMIDAHVGWDADKNKWRDWSDPTKLIWTQPIHTMPFVCSSFIWEAVQQVNADALKSGKPRIRLDSVESPEALGDENGLCTRTVAPDYKGDVVDPVTLEGLYFYDEAARQNAGQVLHDRTAQKVWDAFKGKAPLGLGSTLDNVGGREAFAAAAAIGVSAVQGLLAPLVVVDPVLAEQLIEALYDMPGDIANQLVNAFAFDCCNGPPPVDAHCVDALGNLIDIDSDNWKSAPGVGRTVSPDNIHMFWDPPVPSLTNADQVTGLYGYNVPVQPVVGVTMQPVCALVAGTGTAHLIGLVNFKGTPISGAYVKAGCDHTVTPIANPLFDLEVRAGGNYEVVARYTDPTTGVTWYGQKSTQDAEPTVPVILPNSTVNMGEIVLLAPPRCMRNVIVTGYIRTDDVHVGGADHDEVHFSPTLYVQSGVPVYDEISGWTCDTSNPAYSRLKDYVEEGSFGTSAVARLRIDVSLDPTDLSVSVGVVGTLNPDEDNLQGAKYVGNIPRGGTASIPEIDLDTGGTFPDRAYFRNLQVTNADAQAI